MLRYQVLLQDYGQSGLWKNRKINIKKKEKGKNMKYTADTKPGMGDPYWYEWSVGQKYIIDMLNPDNEIKHVELQADVALGLDDVVITYMDGHKKFVQVKHTRANDTLTFGDLVTIDTSNVDANSHISLLGELAKSWNEEHSKYSTTDILLFSNRKKGKRIAHAGPQSSIKRPALNWFIDDLSKQLETVKKYNELVFPGYELAWEEWKKQLEYIPNDDKKLEFLKHLSISTDQEELEALGETLIEKLKNTFKTNDEIARLLFVRLDHALRKWTTSIRDSSIVSVEDVLRELSIEDDIISYNHDLIPSVPFFESRLSVVEDIEKALSCPQNRVVFLSGIPGTGKTNIISKLSGKRNSIVNIRYYAYEPIDPQKEYLPKDVSRRVDNSVFWNELFNQLRRQLLGKLSKYRVPVINNLLPQEQLRSEFFRIAAEYAQDENSLFIVAIDGIDHAARANVSENTFLSALPNPEYLPENVKIVIAGQPKEDYRNYPEWLFNNEMGYVKEIHVPSILKSDIYSLVENKFPEMDNVFKNQLTNVVCRYADGNTLSAIFAVHEATQCNDIVALEQRLTDRKLSGNIQEYYKAIWDSAKAKFQIPFVDYKMAGVFAFFNEPLNEYKLQKIFSEEGISDSEEARAVAIERLAGEESEDALDYIISVDIFSEGVDVPEINQVIMLRPTESPIVFIQQLGRGLRKAENKEYVVVLDFIGNYRNNFMIPIALSGDRSYNKDNIRRYVTEGGRVIPGASTIHFDEISRKRIFQAIDNANFSDIKLIRENYTNLKNKLGHIPALADFDKYGEMDVLRIFDNNSLGSYYKFLVKYEKEYTIRLSEDEEKAIEFISKKLASGKRIHELELLKRTLQYRHGIIGRLRKHLSEKYHCEMDEYCTENVINMMTNEFPTSAAKKTYAQCVFLKKEQDDYGISDVYGKMLQNPEFCAILEELVDFGISRYKVNYSYQYQDTNLVLYQKYTYEDACRLLNWERNEVPLNIGGYKYDKKTKTFPIFINYDKQDNISDTTKYEDHFVAENRLIAISKSGRSMDSEDVQNFLNATERGIDVQLFVRKNKDDKISKEFYYLGRVIATGNAKQFVMPNTDKTAVEIEWELETPVREDIYQYIVNE